MISLKTSYSLYAFLELYLAYLESCATSASGPTAYVSLAASPPYATIRLAQRPV